jgi:streptogramin lyase
MTRHLRAVIFGLVLCGLTSLVAPVFATTDFVAHPGRAANPYNIIVGPDKNLWFTEYGGEKIGRLTTAGVITEFPIPGALQLVGIAAGPDGNIWFTDQLTGKIGHISTSGTNLKQIALPTGSFPQGITTGRDKNLWFVDQKQNGYYAVGRITVTGKVIEYLTNVNAGVFQSGSFTFAEIAAGPDGNLWFTNPQANTSRQIGKITTSGIISFYPTQDLPLGVGAGPDGNMWTIESSHVASITPAGVETEYPISGGGSPGIVAGPDGNIWFTEANTSLGDVTPAGVVTEYSSLSPTFGTLSSVCSGPDDALWFVGVTSGNIGRLTTGGQLTNSYSLNIGSTPDFGALGADGNVWFSEIVPSRVGNITPSGTITSYPTLSPNATPWAMAAGGDGNIWFMEVAYGQVASITPSGIVTEYPLAGTFAFQGVTGGPDGNVWYTVPFSPQGPSIARITPAGVITLFSLPNPISIPQYITAGPDGNLWFTDSATNQVGKMDTAGNTLAEYPIPTPNSNPSAIIAGPDGNLWFLQNTSFGAVAKITLSGQVTEYPVQIQAYQNGIAAGSDGAIWFAQWYPNSVARVTTDGVVSTVALSTPNAGGGAVTLGGDKKLWVAEGTSGALGRLSAIGGTGKNIKATHGVSYRGYVASFVDGTPTASKTDFTTTIDWGDGSKSSGAVFGSTGGPFTVGGMHTYSTAGTYTVQVQLYDTVDKSSYFASLSVAVVK